MTEYRRAQIHYTALRRQEKRGKSSNVGRDRPLVHQIDQNRPGVVRAQWTLRLAGAGGVVSGGHQPCDEQKAQGFYERLTKGRRKNKIARILAVGCALQRLSKARIVVRKSRSRFPMLGHCVCPAVFCELVSLLDHRRLHSIPSKYNSTPHQRPLQNEHEKKKRRGDRQICLETGYCTNGRCARFGTAADSSYRPLLLHAGEAITLQ